MKNKNNSNDTALFGQRLRVLRKNRGVSQKKLSEKCGYKRSTSISNIEKGNAPVHISSLIAIAELLDIDLHWLITGKLSAAVVRLRPYVTSFLAYRYMEIQEYEKERSDLLVKQSQGEDHSVRLQEIGEKIEYERTNCHRLREFINEALEPMGEKI